MTQAELRNWMQEWDETIQRLNGCRIDLSSCKLVIEHSGVRSKGNDK